MLAVIYRWRPKPGLEAQFADGWARVTRAIYENCGSYGSRLHRVEDGTWLAYARWPDKATRDACDHQEREGQRLMREAVEEDFPDLIMTIRDDHVVEPAGRTG